MAFSFGGQSTPAFGAASAAPAPSFAFGGASAFGAPSSTPGFGAAASTPSLFGATTAPSLFGAAPAPSPFGGAVSTPAFSFSSAAAATGGSLFGATPAGTAPSPFGATSSALVPLGGSAAPSLFGAPQPAAAASQYMSLVTKDNRPVTHSTRWDDLSPQAQHYLLELEKVVRSAQEGCSKLDAEPRLAEGRGKGAARRDIEEAAQGLSQSIAALGCEVAADVEAADSYREVVLGLLRATDAAHTLFQRSRAWREAAKAGGQGQALSAALAEQLSGPVELPSPFLRDAVAGFAGQLRQYQGTVAELEAVLQRNPQGWRGGGGGVDAAAALQAALTNVHSALIHAAARLQAVDDAVGDERDAALARSRAAGDDSDPFLEAERAERSLQQQQGRARGGGGAGPSPAAAARSPAPAPGSAMFGAAPGAAGHSPAAPSPAGLFGTGGLSPAQGFGTPLFDAGSARARKPGSRARK